MMRAFILFLVSAAVATGPVAVAGPISWNNSAGGPWETAANWQPAKKPAQADDVIIAGSGTETISINSIATVHSLVIKNSRLNLVSGGLTVTAVPPPVRYNLAITKSGDGSGTVVSAPNGISCGTNCTAGFNNDKAITLTATADSGSVFNGWSGGGCSGTAPCTLTLTADTGIIATFAKPGGPVAAFSYSHSAPYAGQAVQFSDQSSGAPTSWIWDFGDGSAASTQQSPTHAYAAAGTYSVKLTAGNASGSNIVTKSLTVITTGSSFTLMSDVASNGGRLPAEYAIDGLGSSPALSWVNAPMGTNQYALLMTTLPGDGTTLYNWVLYDIPAGTTALAKNSSGVGTPGTIIDHATSRPGYAPPQSPGGGDKTYTFTLYALSGAPDLTGGTTGAALAAAIALKTVGTASLNLTYARTAPTAGFTWQSADSSVSFTSAGVSGLSATSWLWDFGDGATSTEQNPIHTYTSYNDHAVKLTVGNIFDGITHTAVITRTVTVTASSTVNMGMVQTISDGAQRTTLAFSAFAMMNGNLNTQSFFPPGKVADYTGFQYLRDNDPGGEGHNTSFLTRVSENVIYKLTPAQLQQLNTLATAQKSQVSDYGYGRFKFMKAFRLLLDNLVPGSATGLSLDEVKSASRDLYLIDGQISYDRAALYAAILNSPDAADLKAYMDTQMKGHGLGGWADWPDTSAEPIKSVVANKLRTYVSQDNMVGVMTYAGDLYSWYEGSLAADVYFCPERQGTYYGGFYMKDAPAIGHEGYAISTSLTADVGEVLSNSSKGYVTEAQAAKMSALVSTQRNNLYAGPSSIVSIRLQIATLLRKLLTTSDPVEMASIKSQVLALSGTYGELDGENNYHYATVFAEVYQSLDATQKASLRALYTSVMQGNYTDPVTGAITPFDFSDITKAPLFLYSDKLTGTEPQFIANTNDAAIYPLFGLSAP